MMAYNSGSIFRTPALPEGIRDWSLRTMQLKLIKMGGLLEKKQNPGPGRPSLVVEFAGCAGAGKTSLCIKTFELLRANGIPADMVKPPKIAMLDFFKRLGFNEWRDTPLTKLGKLGLRVLTYAVKEPDIFLFYCRILSGIQRHPGIKFGFSRFPLELQTSAKIPIMMRNLRARPGLFLCGNGICSTIARMRATTTAKDAGLAEKRLINLLHNGNWIVIFVTADSSVIKKRIASRGYNLGTLCYLQDKTVERYASSHRIVEKEIRSLPKAAEGLRVFNINNGDNTSLENNARGIARAVEAYWEALQKGSRDAAPITPNEIDFLDPGS